MKIGLVDVDGHNFPNYALMKISAWHKSRGDSVEWADPMFGEYDRVYMSKVFTFTEDNMDIWHCEVIKGGTGYDIASKLPDEIQRVVDLGYSIYPQYAFSMQFFSRGCIRKCPFCLVRDKEGYIHSVEPSNLNPNGKWIEVLDNNFFANTEWRSAVEWLNATKLPVNLHGVDVRIMNEEQCKALNAMKLHKGVHIAWDLPQLDLKPKLEEVVKWIKPYKLTCYVLVGFNSTMEQDLYRIKTLWELGIHPFVQPYRDFNNGRKPSQYEKDLSRWCNNKFLFKSCDFKDFEPRKGFKCSEYFK